jgi:hypothetical protein
MPSAPGADRVVRWNGPMTTAHYINENKSDMRRIKPGWYAMDDGGKLSSGPFSSREECLGSGNQLTDESTPWELRPRPK